MTKRFVILISGRGSNMQALLENESNVCANIVAIISNNKKAYGLVKAEACGKKTYVIDHKDYTDREAHEQAITQCIEELNVDFILLAGFMRILSPDFVTRWAGKIVNIHPSLLPSFPGLYTHESALKAGVKWVGCTVHFVTAEVDKGPILIQGIMPTKPLDTEESLAKRLLPLEHFCYVQAMMGLSKDLFVIHENQVTSKNNAVCQSVLYDKNSFSCLN